MLREQSKQRIIQGGRDKLAGHIQDKAAEIACVLQRTQAEIAHTHGDESLAIQCRSGAYQEIAKICGFLFY